MKYRSKLKIWLPLIFVPLLFITSFTVNDQKTITNIFRVIICLPVFLLFTREDIKLFFKEPFFRVFTLVLIYTGLTLFLSDGKETNIAGRLLASFLFTYLLFLWCRYNPKYFKQLPYMYMAAGILSMVLVLFNWEGIAELDRWTISYGILDHHTPLSWFFAACAILALGHGLETNERYKLPLFILSVIFSAIVLLSQARGGLVILILGCLFVSASHLKAISFKSALLGLSALFILSLIVIGSNIDFFMELIERGDAGRFQIYQNAWDQITTSPVTFILGHGAGASSDNYIGTFQAAHFHNFYLNTWYWTGLIGLFLNLLLLFIWFKELVITKSINPWDAVVLAMLVGFMFDGTRWYGYPESIMFSFFIPLVYSVLLKAQDRLVKAP